MPHQMRGSIQLWLFALVLLMGCSEKENKINNHPPVAAIRITEDASKFTFDGSLSRDPDGNPLTYKWSSSSSVITITAANQATAFSQVPILSASVETTITLEVTDGQLTSASSQKILVPCANQMKAYGLGENLIAGASNNTDYEWYIDQASTGTYSGVNCGPTSVTMAIRWANVNFTKTPQDARATYRSGGGWWYTSDVINYFNGNGVSNYTIALTSIDLLKNKIDNGSIAILCLDMYFVEHQDTAAYHVSKFYQASTQGWGHFIVIKGYRVVDDQTYFEAYDPFSFGVRYLDNSLKGKDRYYKAANLDAATNNWWDYAIVAPKPGVENGRSGADPDAIDPANILHKSGQ